MAGDQPSQRRREEDDAAAGMNAGWAAVSYMIAGMAVWGLAGALADHWLHTGGIITGIGCVIGLAGGIYLVIRRLGA